MLSKEGEGTSFTLYFGAQRQDALVKPSPLAVPKAGNAAHSARARILLAEDKDDVRLVLEKTLAGAGYDVTSASSGDMGVALFESDPSFDLILTDIVMPGVLQGLDFAKRCRLLRPEVPIVFLSGYSPEATNQGMSSDDIRLMKPVSRSTLLNTVESCLKT